MAMPVGIQCKTKNNDNKHARAHEEWTKGKKLGRPAQQFHPVSNTFSKIMEPRKVTQ